MALSNLYGGVSNHIAKYVIYTVLLCRIQVLFKLKDTSIQHLIYVIYVQKIQTFAQGTFEEIQPLRQKKPKPCWFFPISP